MMKDTSVNFKHLRQTAHGHHPVDDARGHAEALLAMHVQLGLKIGLTSTTLSASPSAVR